MSKLINSGEDAFNEFDSFFSFLTQNDHLSIDLTVVSSEFNGAPGLEIQIDDITVSQLILTEGRHQIQLLHPVKDKSAVHIKISMTGKSPRDTQVIDGNIVKDKYILIEKLVIDNFDITADPDLFFGKFKYSNNQGVYEPVKSGFWQNSTLHIECMLPFVLWYQENTKKNIDLNENLVFQDNKELYMQQYEKLVSKLHLLK